MSERRAVTRKLALEYRRSDKAGEGVIYGTAAESKVPNRIWALQRLLTNHCAPQQNLVSKTRN